MEQMTRRITVLLPAVALLAAALVPAAFAQEKDPPAPAAPPRVERQRPLAELNLTSEQLKALEAFRAGRREKARAFRDDMAKLRDEMRALRADPQANEARIEALIDRRAALTAGREKEALRARAERNKIFTPEQLEKLKGRRFGGRAFGPRAGLRPMSRWPALRHRMAFRRRFW